MKANEFIKKFGLDYAIKFLNYDASIAEDRCVLDFGEYYYLKRLVESHESLFSIWPTVQEAKKQIREHKYNDDPKIVAVYESWIKDVESCQ